MFLFSKRVSIILSNATGYVVIGIFFTFWMAVSLGIPGEFNILWPSGYAPPWWTFYLSPPVVLFLCPALTMRLLAKKNKRAPGNYFIDKTIK